MVLFVEDSGPGVPPALRERIFEPFYTSKGPGHVGLGLAQVARIARQLGGTIRVLDGASLGGARFELKLPLREIGSGPHELPRKVTPSGRLVRPIEVLLVEDEPSLRSALSHLVLPALVVASYPLGVIARMVRASVLGTLGEDHIRMVRALGFPESSIFARFALRPALNPVIAVTALVFAYSLVNTFLVEAIFDWNGLGSYAADSIQALDTPSVIGVTLFVALVYVGANLVVDLLQAFVDPRIRLR